MRNRWQLKNCSLRADDWFCRQEGIQERAK